MADLRALKKEVAQLPAIPLTLQNLQLSWVKPLRARTSSVLLHLEPPQQQEVKKRLGKMKDIFSALPQGTVIQEKLQRYAHYLVELKLTQLQGNRSRRQQLITIFLQDNFLNLRQTLQEIQDFENTVKTLIQHYHAINAYLEEHLPLEGTLWYADLPHQHAVQQLQNAVEQHKRLIRQIGDQFVALAREKSGEK